MVGYWQATSDHPRPIIGRERALIYGLSRALNALVGGPPPIHKTLAAVRRHNSASLLPTARGASPPVTSRA